MLEGTTTKVKPLGPQHGSQHGKGATKSNDRSPVPGTFRRELTQIVLWPPLMYTDVHIQYTHRNKYMHVYKNVFQKKKREMSCFALQATWKVHWGQKPKRQMVQLVKNPSSFRKREFKLRVPVEKLPAENLTAEEVFPPWGPMQLWFKWARLYSSS